MFVVIIRMAFKYDLLCLFELIEARPCLWDRKSPTYKNKTCKEKAWQEIFSILDETYEEQSQEEKKITGTLILTKWANIRDAFIRSLKTTSAKRNYIYADHLQFLLSSHKHNESDGNISFVNVNESNEHDPQKRSRVSELMLARKNKKAKKEILEHLKTKETISKEANFFISFHSYISDMSEAEKLELHMDILKSIKDIKNRRLHATPTNTDCLIEQKCNESYHY